MRKILFIAPDYYGFNEVVFDGLKKYAEAAVFHVISNEHYKYKNFGEKIQNFINKLFLNKNIKNSKQKALTSAKITAIDNLDLTIINRPDLLDGQQLNLILDRSKKTIAILWDSLEKIPVQESVLNRFNSVFSFDEDDCKKYNFKKITNFYFQKKIKAESRFDVAFLGTFDERHPTLLALFDYFKENNYKSKAKLYSYHEKKIIGKHSDSIENINKIIPFNASCNFYADAVAILDLAQPNQAGLSFRPFEAIGLEKKLITTNKNIRNYDFYDPENIFIVGDVGNLKIPETFFTKPYKKLPAVVSDKYFIKNWVENIVNHL